MARTVEIFPTRAAVGRFGQIIQNKRAPKSKPILHPFFCRAHHDDFLFLSFRARGMRSSLDSTAAAAGTKTAAAAAGAAAAAAGTPAVAAAAATTTALAVPRLAPGTGTAPRAAASCSRPSPTASGAASLSPRAPTSSTARGRTTATSPLEAFAAGTGTPPGVTIPLSPRSDTRRVRDVPPRRRENVTFRKIAFRRKRAFLDVPAPSRARATFVLCVCACVCAVRAVRAVCRVYRVCRVCRVCRARRSARARHVGRRDAPRRVSLVTRSSRQTTRSRGKKEKRAPSFSEAGR